VVAADRQEMVALMLEDHSRCGTCLLPIVRDVLGAFVKFGENPVPDFTSAAGRFTGLMPKSKPVAEHASRAKAKAALQALGMCVVNRSFDPSVN
jgi:hypothetical protein